MKFPSRKTTNSAAYFDGYAAELKRSLDSVDRAAFGRAADMLRAAYQSGTTVFTCGNGGSAAIAHHFICDHLKGIAAGTDLKPRVIGLGENVMLLTALANDIDYASIFAAQLAALARAGDILVVISGSGNSPNVVAAAEWARDNGMAVIALTGFDGGKMAKLAQVNLHVPCYNYGIVEDVHQAIMQALAQFLKQERIVADQIADTRF